MCSTQLGFDVGLMDDLSLTRALFAKATGRGSEKSEDCRVVKKCSGMVLAEMEALLRVDEWTDEEEVREQEDQRAREHVFSMAIGPRDAAKVKSAAKARLAELRKVLATKRISPSTFFHNIKQPNSLSVTVKDLVR